MSETRLKAFKVNITAIKRHSTSKNGNPRYQIETDQGTYYTGVDAQLGYHITNLTNEQFPDNYILNQPGIELHGDNMKAIWFVSKDGIILT